LAEVNILTFDIEDWFHILDNSSTKSVEQWSDFEPRIHQNMDLIFRLLEDTDTSATFFCLGWVARKYPEIIRRIDAAGFEVATHSDLHQLAFEQSPQIFEEDLKRSIDSLATITGKKVRAYRAPGFSLKEENKWVFDVLVKHGIEIDCSIFPAFRPHGGFKSFGIAEPCRVRVGNQFIKEFPINLGVGNMVFSGGGYFRLFPYHLLSRWFKQTPYVMTYFHPRDFDGNQPILDNLSILRRFKSYYGLNGCLVKLKKLLLEQDFIDLAEAEQRVHWDKTKIKEL
jgi:polysaccharide deacetylase family protein (PEP-CTERM system associated)